MVTTTQQLHDVHFDWSEYFICVALHKIKHTAAGYDDIPYWYFKLFACEISPILCKLINTLVSHGFIPDNWTKAIICPVAKCHPVVDVRDFRPISVTSLLCRLVKKILIETYITPALAKLQLNDQYAYKPTGSTTGALVDFTHKVSMLLETHDCSLCFN